MNTRRLPGGLRILCKHSHDQAGILLVPFGVVLNLAGFGVGALLVGRDYIGRKRAVA